MKSIKKFITSLMLVFVMMTSVIGGYSLAGALPVDAQVRIPDTCEGDCPLIGTNVPTNVNENTIVDFILGVAQFVTFIVIALAVLFLVYGGFLFVTDSGDGKRAENGKKILFNAIIGLVLAIVAFTIVRVISEVVAGDVAGQFIN